MGLSDPSGKGYQSKPKPVIVIDLDPIHFMKPNALLGILFGVFSALIAGTQSAASNQCGIYEAMGIDDLMLASMGCPTRRQMNTRGGSAQQTCNMWAAESIQTCGDLPQMVNAICGAALSITKLE